MSGVREVKRRWLSACLKEEGPVISIRVGGPKEAE